MFVLHDTTSDEAPPTATQLITQQEGTTLMTFIKPILQTTSDYVAVTANSEARVLALLILRRG